MSKKIIYKSTVRNKGGKSAGMDLENEVPDFDWEEFKKLPLARVFAKKAYFEEIIKIMRESAEQKNQTMECDLQSIESVIARSLTFTKPEISEWFDRRNWGVDGLPPELESTAARERFKAKLLTLSRGPVIFEEKQRKKYANLVAKVADKPTDDVADYLFSRLSLKSILDDLDDDSL